MRTASDHAVALLAVLARKGPVSISPEDLEAAEDLELVVSEAPFGDPPGSRILEARKPGDPRRDKVAHVLAASGIPPRAIDELSARILDAVDEAER